MLWDRQGTAIVSYEVNYPGDFSYPKLKFRGLYDLNEQVTREKGYSDHFPAIAPTSLFLDQRQEIPDPKSVQHRGRCLLLTGTGRDGIPRWFIKQTLGSHGVRRSRRFLCFRYWHVAPPFQSHDRRAITVRGPFVTQSR